MNKLNKYDLPYTLFFCRAGDRMLMLHRKQKPNQYHWNGLGGKIEANETPEQGLKRELFEESGLNLDDAKSVIFSGIVTWTTSEQKVKGTHTYIIDFPESFIDHESRETREGVLEWKPVTWVCDKENPSVVDNIPHFLPKMLSENTPMHFHLIYQSGVLKDIIGQVMR